MMMSVEHNDWDTTLCEFGFLSTISFNNYSTYSTNSQNIPNVPILMNDVMINNNNDNTNN